MYQIYKERKICVAFCSIELFKIKKHKICFFTARRKLAN